MPCPGAEPPLGEHDQVWGVSGSAGDSSIPETELNHPCTRIKDKRSWLELKNGSNAFWELDSVVPASLCLNEVLLKGQEEASGCLEQQASSALVRAAGGQELSQRQGRAAGGQELPQRLF